MSMLSVGCVQRAIIAAVSVVLLGAADFIRSSFAKEIHATGLGFVDKRYPDDDPQGEFQPAVLFRSREGRSYLLTNSLIVMGYSQLCFIQDGTLNPISVDGWLDESTSSSVLHGPDLYAYYIPVESLDDDTRKIFAQVTVNESDFVPVQVGLPVQIRGQTHNVYTAGQDVDGIIAASGHVGYEGYFSEELQTPKIDYNVILPASSGCPAMSWVQLNRPSGQGQAPFVGLIFSHLTYKLGDCFLDIDDLKLLCNENLLHEMFERKASPVAATASKSGLVYNLKDVGDKHVDDWIAHGATHYSIGIFSTKFESMFRNNEAPDPKDLGIVSNLIQMGERYYLLVDATYAARLKSDSKVCFRVSGDVRNLTISDCFAWTPQHHILIDDSLVALPSRESVKIPDWIHSAAQQLDSAIDVEEEFDAIFGMSHTDGVLRKRIEESLVYYLDITFTQENYGLKPVPSFNSGIYPTILFGVRSNRQQLFGILGFNRATQEPTIYSAAELREFLSGK